MYTNLSQTCAPYHYRHRHRRRHHCRCRHQFTCIDYKATVSPIECKWCFNPHICGLHKRFKDSVIAEVTETKRTTKSKMKRNSGKRMVCDKFVSSTSYKHTPNIWRKEDEKSFTATNNKQTPIRHYKRGGLFADRTWFTFSRSDFKINWLKYWILDKMRQLCFYGLNTERKWATKRKKKTWF